MNIGSKTYYKFPYQIAAVLDQRYSLFFLSRHHDTIKSIDEFSKGNL